MVVLSLSNESKTDEVVERLETVACEAREQGAYGVVYAMLSPGQEPLFGIIGEVSTVEALGVLELLKATLIQTSLGAPTLEE